MTGKTPPSEQKRQVAFLVIDRLRSTSELALTLDCPVDEVSLHRTRGKTPKTEVVWEIKRDGDGTTDLTELIQAVIELAKAKQVQLTQLSTDPAVKFVLQIVHYVGDSGMGPGFAIQQSLLAWLGKIGASVDVDQYWCP